MHLMGCQNLMALAGSRQLFNNITLGLQDGDKIGVLGPNGGGKTTLLRLLSGKQKADDGSVTVSAGTKVAMLDQNDQIDGDLSVQNAIHGDKAEYLWATDSQIRQIHKGLLADIDIQDKVSTLSGGQKRRVALAKVLCSKADVTFLDEPTNHLDITAITWLAQHLNQRYSNGTGALVVITHDRWFLDAVCTKIWEVVPGLDAGNGADILPGTVEFYEGSYAAYILARAERDRQAQVIAQKRNNLLKKELAWLRRGAPARTSKPKFRIAEAETLIADVPPLRNKVELQKMATSRLGKDVIDLENVTLNYFDEQGTEKTVLDDVTFRIGPGDRIGILGANGAGKTSLIKLIEGVLEPTAGKVKRGKTVKVAVLSQSTHELDEVAHLRVVEAVSVISNSIVVGGKEISAAELTRRLGFSKSRAWTRVSELSGGERRRLQFMRILMTEPNVLLLDEPTNDLDTDTLAAMEDILDAFVATLIVVSHDRYLLERVTDYQMLVKDQKLTMLVRGVEQYLEILQQQESSAKPATQKLDANATETEQLPAEAKNTLDSATRRKYVKELSATERKMDKLQAELHKLSTQLEEIATSADYEKMQQLSEEVSQRQSEYDELETRWLELSDVLENE